MEMLRRCLHALVLRLPKPLKDRYWSQALNYRPWLDVGYEPGFGRFYSPREIILAMWVEMGHGSRMALKALGSADETIRYHHGWGTSIRNHYGLWRPANPYTDASDDEGGTHPDDLSGKILQALWMLVARDATPNEAFRFVNL